MKKLLLFICIIGICTSCKDFLNLTPKNQVAVYTLEDVKQTMSSYLFAMASNDQDIYFNGETINYPFDPDITESLVMYGDDVSMLDWFYYQIGWYYEDLYQENIEWNGLRLASQLWKRLFLSIGYMNEIFHNLENVPDKDGNYDDYMRIKAEAKLFRAYYVFKLTQFFSPYKDNRLGIPLNLSSDNVIASERWKQTDVYKFILDELHEVEQYEVLPTKWDVMYNQEVIHSLLAEVYWYKAESAAAEDTDWSNAEKYSNLIVAKRKLATTREELFSMFIPDDKPIGIVKDNLFTILQFVYYDQDKTGYSFGPWGAEDERQLPTQELVKLYEKNDIRLDAYLGYQEMDGSDKWYVQKWNTYKKHYNVVRALFRVAEMYLINAEAKARMGQMDQAKEVLEKFKSSRIPGYGSFTGDVLQEILNERRKEFCYEGDFRFIDMKRLSLRIERKGLDVNDDSIHTFNLESDDYRYTLPIPYDAELKYNNIEQNPGWHLVE